MAESDSVTISQVSDLDREWAEIEPLMRELVEHHEPLHPFTLTDDWAERLKERYRDPHSVVFVARAGGTAVGFTDARLLSDPSIFAERFVSIGNMHVHTACRRRGIGSRLLKAVEQWAVDQHVAEIRLNVVTANDGALAFYRRAGMAEWIVGMRRKLL